MSKESREIEKLNPDEEVGKKRKIVFWSLIATGIGVIVVIALLLIFLLPKDDKFEIDLGSNVSVEDGTLTGEGSYKKGDNVTIVAEDIEGYRFIGWSYGGNIISTDKEFTFQINEENEGEYTANYAKEYNIDIQSGNLTVAIEGNKTNAIAGEEVIFTIEDQDYQIRKVYLSFANETKELVAQDGKYTFTMPESDVEIVVESSKIYSVTLGEQSEYGEFNIEPMQATSGETITVNFELKDEYLGIYSLKRLYYVVAGDLQGTQTTIENNRFTMPEGNVTIYAEFNNLYNINLTTNIDEEVDLTGEGTYIENETVTISAPNIAGYRFRNWTYNGQVVTTQQEYIIANIDSTTSGTYIANYDRLYSITVNSSHGTVAIVDNKTNAIENENIEFTVEPNSDYRLIEVKVNNETLQAQDGKYSFAMPAENVTIDVTYSQLFDISVTSEHGDVTIVDNKTEAIANENVSFTITPEENYRIESITINNGDVEYTQDENIYSFTMPAQNVSIVVTYIQQFEVILQSDMENADLSGADTYDIGTEVFISASESIQDNDMNWYQFKCWMLNDQEISQESNYMFTMSADTAGTYTAIYERAYQIDVEQNSNIKVTIDEDKMMAVEGEDVSFTVEVDPGYRLLSVEANQTTLEEKDGKYSFKMPAEDVSIKVTIAQVYNITVNQNANASIQVDKTQAIKDESVEITVQANSGYRITGVYYTLNSEKQEITLSGDKYILTMPEGNVEISVEVVGQYQITLNSNIDSEVPDIAFEGAGLYDDGASVTIKAPNVEGYRFRNWSFNSQTISEQNYTFNISQELAGTYTANYDKLYDITTDSNIDVSDDTLLGGGSYIEGESVTLSAKNIEGYRFAGWYFNDSLVSSSLTYHFNMQTDKAGTYTAKYDLLYTISKAETQNGSFDVTSQAIHGEEITVSVTANEGYETREIYYLIDNGGSKQTITDNKFTMPDGNITVYVIFEKIDFNITTQISNGEISGLNSTAQMGDNITFTISTDGLVDDKYYAVDRVYYLVGDDDIENTLTPQDNTYSLTMPADDITIVVVINQIQTYKDLVLSGNSAEINLSLSNSVVIPESYSIASVPYEDVNSYVINNKEEINISNNTPIILQTMSRAGHFYAKCGDEEERFIKDGATFLAEIAQDDSKFPVTISYRDYQFTNDEMGNGYPIVLALYQAFFKKTSVTFILDDSDKLEVDCENIADIDALDAEISKVIEAISTANPTNIQVEFGKTAHIAVEGSEYTVTRLSNGLFNLNVTEFTIPSTITVIDSTFGEYNESLLKVNYGGTIDEWVSIDFSNNIHSSPFFYLSKAGLYIDGQLVTDVQINVNVNRYAFYDYDYLESVSFGDNTSIDNDAFYGCINLTSVDLNNVETLGDRAFYGCTSLTEITMPASINSIGKDAFRSCSSLTEITIPAGVIIIEEGTFSGCTSLTEITISANVESIGNWAFSDCSKLSTVVIESDDIYNTSTGSSANGGLLYYATTIKVLKTIVDDPNNTNDYLNSTQFERTVDVDSDYYVYTEAVANTVSINSSVSGKVSADVNQAYAGDEITLTVDTAPIVESDQILTFSKVYYLESGSDTEHEITSNESGKYAFIMPNKAITINIGYDSYNRLDDYTIENGKITGYSGNETSLIIPSYYNTININEVDYVIEQEGTTITEIGDNAFAGCSTLASVELPSTITKIGSGAFSNCTNLINISVPDGIESIAQNAFDGSHNIKTTKYNDSYYIGNSENVYLVLLSTDWTGNQSAQALSATSDTQGLGVPEDPEEPTEPEEPDEPTDPEDPPEDPFYYDLGMSASGNNIRFHNNCKIVLTNFEGNADALEIGKNIVQFDPSSNLIVEKIILDNENIYNQLTSYSAISNLISNASVVEIPSVFVVDDYNIDTTTFKYNFSYGEYLVFSKTQINKGSVMDEIIADEFIESVNQNYGDALAQRMIGRNATREDLANADWAISQSSERGISQIEVKVVYVSGLNTVLSVGTITFDQEYSVQDIIDGNAGSPMVSRVYNTSIGTSNIIENLDLGETVIQTIDPDNTLEGNIWCNITNMFIEDGKYYRVITVYQITESGVEQYELRVEDFSSIPADPFIIITLIEEGKYSNASQSTEYTFSGMKIEQI